MRLTGRAELLHMQAPRRDHALIFEYSTDFSCSQKRLIFLTCGRKIFRLRRFRSKLARKTAGMRLLPLNDPYAIFSKWVREGTVRIKGQGVGMVA